MFLNGFFDLRLRFDLLILNKIRRVIFKYAVHNWSSIYIYIYIQYNFDKGVMFLYVLADLVYFVAYTILRSRRLKQKTTITRLPVS